jgi:hypothetical protein
MRQTYERLKHSKRVPLRIALAACSHVDNRLCNQLGDRSVSVCDVHIDQGGLISSLHNLDFIGAEGTVSNQFVNRHTGDLSFSESERVCTKKRLVPRRSPQP